MGKTKTKKIYFSHQKEIYCSQFVISGVLMQFPQYMKRYLSRFATWLYFFSINDLSVVFAFSLKCVFEFVISGAGNKIHIIINYSFIVACSYFTSFQTEFTHRRSSLSNFHFLRAGSNYFSSCYEILKDDQVKFYSIMRLIFKALHPYHFLRILSSLQYEVQEFSLKYY